MSFARFVVLGALSAIAACGGASTDDGPKLLTSHQDLCAGAPPETVDHIVTAESCPFVQHADNIVKYGEKISGPTTLYDGTGAVVATVTNTCDTWAIGTDPQGIVVLIERDNGDVISHGMIHPGQPMSTLSTPRVLPFAIK